MNSSRLRSSSTMVVGLEDVTSLVGENTWINHNPFEPYSSARAATGSDTPATTPAPQTQIVVCYPKPGLHLRQESALTIYENDWHAEAVGIAG